MANEDKDVVTMLDVLQDEAELSDQAAAVLSGSDEKNCNGFKKRQALYSCLTCAPEGFKNDYSKSIGVCLACSLNCHEKHELIELYTKRNFCCDCGIKEGSSSCQLDPTKSSQTTPNSYNQNFSGVYCTCHRPYPDPENPAEQEMIQCVACEDWFHSNHLSSKVPPSEAYEEMICGACMTRIEFLNDYRGFAIEVVEGEGDNNESLLNVTSGDESGTKRPAETDAGSSSDPKKMKFSEGSCLRPKAVDSKTAGAATFWKCGWRKDLCKCPDCLNMYEIMKVNFLIDLEDPTQVYEEKGKGQVKQSNYMASMEALSSLPRVNQIDAISGYNRMKDKLFEFLQTFVTNNQIVQEEDIQRFFRNMKNEPNDQPAHQPHFCR